MGQSSRVRVRLAHRLSRAGTTRGATHTAAIAISTPMPKLPAKATEPAAEFMSIRASALNTTPMTARARAAPSESEIESAELLKPC